jgi:uncharacterized phage protein gp47/JayE
MPTLSDLFTVPTKEAVRSRLLSLLAIGGFPVTAWGAGNLARHLIEAFATYGADLGALIVAIAKSGFLDSAEDAWLDLLAAGLFLETRKPSVATRGLVVLRDEAGQGPFDLTPGSVWIANKSRTRRFRNVERITAPLGGEVRALFEAESPGDAWNVGNGELVEILTPGGTGVAVANPARGTDPWITLAGSDREKDPALRQRCRDKWATLGSGSNEAAYRYWASTASPEVARVRVLSDPATGLVTVRVASAIGAVSREALAAVDAVLVKRRPLSVGTLAANSEAASILFEGILYTTGADLRDAVAERLRDYARTTDIGGVIFRARLIAEIMAVPGMINVALLAPLGDVTVPDDRVFVPEFRLTARAA